MRAQLTRSQPSIAIFLISAAVLGLCLFAATSAEGREEATTLSPDPPNILVLFSDDTSFYAASPYGDPLARTPVLQTLASQGIVFTQFCANSPFCKPSRNTLFTSLFPHQHGWLTNSVSMPAPVAGEYLPGLLRQDGYVTQGFGKWHSSFSPAEAGFDAFAVSESPAGVARQFLRTQAGATEPWFLFVSFEETHAPWDEAEPSPFPWETRPPGGSASGHLNLRGNVNAPRVGKPAVQEHFEEVGFEKLARQGLDPNFPHVALLPYYDEAAWMDRQIAKILRTLENLGMSENTLVVYTADQGIMAGNHFLWYKGPASYEELMRVPLIARWPLVIEPGSVSDAALSLVDLAPTLLKAAEVSIPREFEGRHFLNVLKGHGFDPEKFSVFQTAMDAPLSGQVRTLRTNLDDLLDGRWKLVLTEGDLPELYDLVNDPLEFHNLAADPAYLEQLDALREELVDWMEDYDDPAWSIFQTDS